MGGNATILRGVEIGIGAVVGAGAVVTKSVPPYTIVAGVPARVVSKRFGTDTIATLVASRWWEYSPDEVRFAIKAAAHVADANDKVAIFLHHLKKEQDK